MKSFSFLSPEVTKGTFRLTLFGREEALVEQHRGLYSNDPRKIRVRTREGVLSVTGENMVIAHFGAQDLLIRGQITGAALEQLP